MYAHQGIGGKYRIPIAYMYSSGKSVLQQQSQQLRSLHGQPMVEQKPSGPPVAHEQSHTCETQVSSSALSVKSLAGGGHSKPTAALMGPCSSSPPAKALESSTFWVTSSVAAPALCV